MVTVITTPIPNGFNGNELTENERLFQLIKDFQEVNLYQTPSSKPLPQDLFETIDGQVPKSSIKGTFLVQIDKIEPIYNQKEQVHNSFLLTITDGINIIQAVTLETIPNLNLNIKQGSKLLLTETILIKDGFLQLTCGNSRFHFGSNTYPRPRSAYRGRTSGSSRGTFEGRRNNRYDNNDGESNILKHPLPKNTLMDFMKVLKLPNDNEEETGKERNSQSKRRFNADSYPQSNKSNNTSATTHYSMNNNHYPTGFYNDQIVFEQGAVLDESFELEDDGTYSIQRERRNPLPPRFQRAQEERSRRNPTRYYDDLSSLINTDPNSIYRPDGISNPSSSSYLRHQEQASSLAHHNPNSFMAHTNMLAPINGSTPTHLAYFTSNANPLTYSLASMSSPPYANQQLPVGPGYSNGRVTYCYGTHYPMQSYMPVPPVAEFNDAESDDNEKRNSKIETQNEEKNDSANQSDSSTNELKTAPSSNDSNTFSQKINVEQQEEKRRSSHSNPRPRWKIGDVCFARWCEDGEFYHATVEEIQPPYCTVRFNGYNNYERVHFSDLEQIPFDQTYYQYAPPSIVPSSDFSNYIGNPYFAGRPDYYSTIVDGCLMMPEVPPYPFNSDGTLCIYPVPLVPTGRPTRSAMMNGGQSRNRRNENGNSTINSSSLAATSKDSDETSGIDSTMTSNEDQQQEQVEEHKKGDSSCLLTQVRPCSIADAPLTLVMSNDVSTTKKDPSINEETRA